MLKCITFKHLSTSNLQPSQSVVNTLFGSPCIDMELPVRSTNPSLNFPSFFAAVTTTSRYNTKKLNIYQIQSQLSRFSSISLVKSMDELHSRVKVKLLTRFCSETCNPRSLFRNLLTSLQSASETVKPCFSSFSVSRPIVTTQSCNSRLKQLVLHCSWIWGFKYAEHADERKAFQPSRRGIYKNGESSRKPGLLPGNGTTPKIVIALKLNAAAWLLWILLRRQIHGIQRQEKGIPAIQ